MNNVLNFKIEDALTDTLSNRVCVFATNFVSVAVLIGVAVMGHCEKS